MKQSGFTELTNTNTEITFRNKSFNLVGLDDVLGEPNPHTAFKGLDENKYNLVLVHNLDSLTSIAPEHIDLVLSGHTHAGEKSFMNGAVSGIDYLMLIGYFANINGQTSGFKFLTDRTLSFVNPGFSARFDRGSLPTQGCTIIELKKYDIDQVQLPDSKPKLNDLETEQVKSKPDRKAA